MSALDHRRAPGHDPIDEHVAALAAALLGPTRAKTRMLTEARDGLTDAAAALADGSTPDDEAAREAVRDFGTVAEIAPAFQRELTIAQARRTARAVALTVPFLIAGRHLLALPDGSFDHAAQLVSAHVAGVAAVAALVATASLTATGALARRLPTPRRLPLVVAWTATVASAAVAVGAVTVTAAALLAGNWPLGVLTATLAIATHARVAASARACRQCARVSMRWHVTDR